MLNGEQAVKDYLEMTDCKCFIIYQASRKTVPVYRYEGDGGTATCKAKFAEWAKLNQYSEPIEYLITIYPKGKPQKRENILPGETNASPRDAFQTNFYLKSPYNDTPAPQINGIGYGPNPNLPGFVAGTMKTEQQLRAEWEKDLELKELKEKVGSIEEAQIRMMNRVSSAIPYVMQAITGRSAPPENNAPRRPANIPASSAVNGDDPAGEQIALDRQRIQGSLAKLFKAGMTLEDLEKLSEMPSKNPLLFNTALTFIRTS